MKLLTTSNTKIKKGESLGFLTFGVHLAPSTKSGFNTCQHSSVGCAAACLDTAGHGIFATVQAARIAKTKFFFQDKALFMAQLFKEIASAIKSAQKKNLVPCFRLNLTSDLPWEKITLDGKTVFDLFPQVTFYDYTKSAQRMTAFLTGEFPSNYHLTFSRSESTKNLLMLFLAVVEMSLSFSVAPFLLRGKESTLSVVTKAIFVFLTLKTSLSGLSKKAKQKKILRALLLNLHDYRTNFISCVPAFYSGIERIILDNSPQNY